MSDSFREAVRAFLSKNRAGYDGDWVALDLALKAEDARVAAFGKGEPVKRWPFAESPGEFADRLNKALGSDFNGFLDAARVLAAVRTVLIERPPALACWVRDAKESSA